MGSKPEAQVNGRSFHIEHWQVMLVLHYHRQQSRVVGEGSIKVDKERDS